MKSIKVKKIIIPMFLRFIYILTTNDLLSNENRNTEQNIEMVEQLGDKKDIFKNTDSSIRNKGKSSKIRFRKNFTFTNDQKKDYENDICETSFSKSENKSKSANKFLNNFDDNINIPFELEFEKIGLKDKYLKYTKIKDCNPLDLMVLLICHCFYLEDNEFSKNISNFLKNNLPECFKNVKKSTYKNLSLVIIIGYIYKIDLTDVELFDRYIKKSDNLFLEIHEDLLTFPTYLSKKYKMNNLPVILKISMFYTIIYFELFYKLKENKCVINILFNQFYKNEKQFNKIYNKITGNMNPMNSLLIISYIFGIYKFEYENKVQNSFIGNIIKYNSGVLTYLIIFENIVCYYDQDNDKHHDIFKILATLFTFLYHEKNESEIQTREIEILEITNKLLDKFIKYVKFFENIKDKKEKFKKIRKNLDIMRLIYIDNLYKRSNIPGKLSSKNNLLKEINEKHIKIFNLFY